MVEIRIQFEGQAAHAAYDPWNGRSALDALELTTFAINQLREHVKPSVRMHYTITGGGDVPNVIPEHAGLWLWLRDSSHDGVNELIGRARKIVEGAAIATETTGELNVITGTYEMLSNIAGARLIQRNFEWLGPMQFDQGEIDFARELQKATGKEQLGMNTTAEPFDDNPGEPEGGSTDVADVSWKVSHPATPGGHCAHRNTLARLAGGRCRRYVHRAQGHALRCQEPGGHHGRPVRGCRRACSNSRGVAGGQGRARIQILPGGRSAATSRAMSGGHWGRTKKTAALPAPPFQPERVENC